MECFFYNGAVSCSVVLFWGKIMSIFLLIILKMGKFCSMMYKKRICFSILLSYICQ